jgi:hypothetical protein
MAQFALVGSLSPLAARDHDDGLSLQPLAAALALAAELSRVSCDDIEQAEKTAVTPWRASEHWLRR